MPKFPIIIFSILAASLLIIPTNSGVIVTADSVRYISAAENLAHGKGYVDYGGKKMAAFTPGYALALAVPLAMGISREQSVVSVNWLALVLIGIFSWLILQRMGAGKWSWLGAAVIMALPHNIQASQSALSEGLFLALVLAWGYAVMRVKGWRWALGASALGVALCITRHAGVGLLLGAFIALRGWKRWAVAVPGVVALAAWILLNGAGENTPTAHKPWSDLAEMLNGYWIWITALMPLAFLLLWKRARILAWAAAGWMIVMFTACVLVDLGDTGTRMITPAVTLLILGLFTSKVKINRWMVVFLSVFLLVKSVDMLRKDRELIKGFNMKSWSSSPTIKQLADLPDNLIYSNAPDGIWWVTGRVTQPLPRTDGRTPQIANALPMTGACIAIYFKSQPRHYYGDPLRWKDRVMKDKDGNVEVFETKDAYVMKLGAE